MRNSKNTQTITANRHTKVLLYSGGMDSWLISKLWKPDVKLYIDIEGEYSTQEILRLPEDVVVYKLPLSQFEQPVTHYVPLRNLFFLMIASNFGDTLCLGATAGDRGAKDKTPEFLDRCEDMLNFLLSEQSVSAAKHVTIERRFVDMSKDEMVKEYLAGGGAIEDVAKNTFSCYTPVRGKACFSCKPCFRRFVTLYNNGFAFSGKEKRLMCDYIKKNVLVKKTGKTGTFYKDRYKEGKDCVKAVNKLLKEMGETL